MTYRIEHDTMGAVEIPADRIYGAQTQRSINNFKIGPAASMPKQIIQSFAYLKKAAAYANHQLETLSLEKRDAIAQACDQILAGELNNEFPLVIWQTGSGTQSNMNVNEVIANQANLNSGREIGVNPILHPNDDVNKAQSSNDTFPTATSIAAYTAVVDKLLPAIKVLRDTFAAKSKEYYHIIKIGRTHLMDATPLTLGQELSAYVAQLDYATKAIENTLAHLSEVAIGGTAVGTGLNTKPGYDQLVVKYLKEFTTKQFTAAPNKFEALSAQDNLVESHGAIKQLAMSLYKIANDVRLLASGPRSGIGEILIPENEPGSSIMPGKVNPTQCEAMTMVCAQVFGNDTTISFAGSQGHFQLNVYRPVMVANFLQSVELLSDALLSFNDNCAVGIEPNHQRIKTQLEQSLMLVTILNGYIGYDNAAKIAKTAHKDHSTLKEAAVKLGLLTAEQFDEYVKPELMVNIPELVK